MSNIFKSLMYITYVCSSFDYLKPFCSARNIRGVIFPPYGHREPSLSSFGDSLNAQTAKSCFFCWSKKCNRTQRKLEDNVTTIVTET